MRIGVYTRVSQARGAKRGKSTGEQEAECREDIAEHFPDAAIVEPIYCDDDRGASRYSRKARPEWARLLGDLRAGRLDMLVTWEASRAQRDLEVYVELRKLCRQTGTLWRYDGRTYDLADDDDAYRTGQDALDAEREAGKTRKRVLRAVRSRAAAGRPHAGVLYGYRREYDPATREYLRTVPHEDQAPIVREIFRRAAAGAGTSAIAAHLTRSGVPTSSGGAAWRPSSVRHILTNEGYLGRRVSKAGHAPVENAWPALVAEALWWQVQARYVGGARTPRTDPAVKHLLSGIAACGPCGAKLGYNPRPDRRQGATYDCTLRHCVARSAGAWSPDPAQAGGLEGQVVESVLALWVGDPRIGEPDDDPRVGEAEAEVRALRAQLGAWHDSIGTSDGPSPAAVAAAERNLEPQIAAAEQRLAGLRARGVLPDLGGRSLREAWPGLDLLRQRAIIAASVTVRVLPVGRGVRGYDPARVEIKPRW